MNTIVVIFFIALISSIWILPSATSALCIIMLVFSIALALTAIFKKHKASENPRPKIAKDISIFILTLLLIIFLGGFLGVLANQYTSPRFGAVVGLICALAASFAVGYLVKKGVSKIFG